MNNQLIRDIFEASGDIDLFIRKATLLCDYNKLQQSKILAEFRELCRKYHPMPDGDLRNTIFEDIDDDYAYCQYGNHKLVIMQSNGYANASMLCIDSDKRFGDWLSQPINRKLVMDLIRFYGLELEQILIFVGIGPNKVHGTYVHPDLLPYIASWCSRLTTTRIPEVIALSRSKYNNRTD